MSSIEHPGPPAESWTTVTAFKGKRRYQRGGLPPDAGPSILLKLPSDTWLSIFQDVILEQALSDVTVSPIISFSRVCRFWYHLTRSTPTLWTRISLPVSPSSYNIWGPNVLLLHLNLSKDMPIHVSLDGRFNSKDWFAFHAECDMWDLELCEPESYSVYKRRASDDVNHTFQIEQRQGKHKSCQKWMKMLHERYDHIIDELNLHSQRLRSLEIRMQTIPSDGYGHWGQPLEFTWCLFIDDEKTRFPELTDLFFASETDDSLYFETPTIFWTTSEECTPKLLNLEVRDVIVVDSRAHPEQDDMLPAPPQSMTPLYAKLSGHQFLTSLSLCSLSLHLEETVGSLLRMDSILSFPTLAFLCIDDTSRYLSMMSDWESDHDFKTFLIRLDTPSLQGIDFRGACPVEELVDYLLTRPERLGNLSSVRQIRLTGELDRNDGQLSVIFEAMPEICQASFHGRICQQMATAIRDVFDTNKNNNVHYDRPGGEHFWRELEDLAMHCSRTSHHDRAALAFLFSDGAGPQAKPTALRRLYLSYDGRHCPPLLRQWIEGHGIRCEDWERDCDAWPWVEKSSMYN